MKPVYLFSKILITGGIVLGLELAASRIMTPFFGVSIYVWSAILAVTLIALAIGYKAGGILTAILTREKALLLFAASGALCAAWLILCVWTYPFLFWPISGINLVLGSIAASLYLLFVPLIILSALNPLLVALLENKGAQGDHGAGGVFFISTIGSVLGVFVVAYGMLPYFTNYQTIVILTALSAALSICALAQLKDSAGKIHRKAMIFSVIVFVIVLGTFLSGGLERFAQNIRHNDMEWRVAYSAPSFFGNVQVVDIYNIKEGRLASRALLNDGLLQNQFSSRKASVNLYTYALEKMALSAAKNPSSALVLGIGAGVIPTAYWDKGLDVTAVDINPRIVQAAEEFFEFDPSLMEIKLEDARTAARHCDKKYDVVAIDLFKGDGIPEHLVTREFFEDVKNCMNDQGIVVMNSFMNTEDPRSMYALLKTIAYVFGEVSFYPRGNKDYKGFTVAFLMARKGGAVGDIHVSYEDMPVFLHEDMQNTLANVQVLKDGDSRLSYVPVLSDISNQWKHLAHSSELAYRQDIVSKLPWQILIN